MLYLDRPLLVLALAPVWVGRFGYSDLKEAAFSGAAALWELDGFSWSGGLVAELCGVAEQAESGFVLSSMRSDVWFGDRVGAAAEVESGLGCSLGGHAVAWLGFEAGVACSCGASVLLWWGTRKQLSWGEPLDDAHGSAAEWAPRKGHGRLGCVGGVFSSAPIDPGAKQAEAERQQLRSLSVGEEAEVADADEAAWEQVQQEAAEELVCRQAHDALPVVVRGVPPAEADLTFSEGDQPAVGDADAMGIRAQVAQRVLRAAEGPLGVDDPVVTEQDSEPGGEAAWLGKRCEVTMELELAFVERCLQAGEKLAPEDASEHLHRQEEGTT